MYTDIIKAVIALAVSCITAFVIPWLKSKIDSNDIAQIEALARIGVYAAEQLFTDEQREEKKKYVQEYLTERGYDISMQEVDAAIEAAVLSLHKQLKEAVADGNH